MQFQTATQHAQLPLFASFNTSVSPAVSVVRKASPETATNASDFFSEISLQGSEHQCLHLLAPMLRALSEEQGERWLTFISPPAALTQQWLRDAGLNRERILILRPSGLQSSQELACEALRLGKSHTVISWLNPLVPSAQRKLIRAARLGESQSLNIKHPFSI
ncbi:SOS-induced cell division inhibitor SulA [Pseudomonas sp. F1_0610]|uniref:SOS-induced cell division inhibitor SulA n=1 Tax=Pseudomonas sp. F1_0610 TaxID=3114284 RepID=UPI0039C10E2A